MLDYRRNGDREAVEKTLRSLERADAHSNEGLLFTVSYAPVYFDRFDAAVPESDDLPGPETMLPFEHPELDRLDGGDNFGDSS